MGMGYSAAINRPEICLWSLNFFLSQRNLLCVDEIMRTIFQLCVILFFYRLLVKGLVI